MLGLMGMLRRSVIAMREIKLSSSVDEFAIQLAKSRKLTVDDAREIVKMWIGFEEAAYNVGDYDDA